MEILTIIPARSKSKSIKNKNIRIIAGKPLIAYSIELSLTSKLINRTIVSTDSNHYSKIAKHFGAEVPFLRPAKISGDYSTDIEVFLHALKWLKKNEKYEPDICVHLRPTHPIRKLDDLNNMIRFLINNKEYDCVRSIVPVFETPFKMWFRNSNGLLSPVVKTNIREAYNKPRQILPKAYIQNASIDIVRTETILKKKSMTGDKIFGYIMDEYWDIDEYTDLKEVRRILKNRNS